MVGGSVASRSTTPDPSLVRRGSWFQGAAGGMSDCLLLTAYCLLPTAFLCSHGPGAFPVPPRGGGAVRVP